MKVLPALSPHVFTDALINVTQGFRRIGAEIKAVNDKDESHIISVTSIENGTLTADDNQQLAVQTATFSVTNVSIRRAKDEEMRRGIPDQDPL